MDTLYDYYSAGKQWTKAVRVVEALALEHPTEAAFYDRAGNIYGELKDDANAVCWFRQSFAISPDFEKAHKIFVLYLKQDRPADAMPFLDYAISNNASGLNLAPVKQLTREIIQLQQALRTDSSALSTDKHHNEGPDPAILNSIAAKYLAMGNHEGAARYIDSVLRIDPKNKEALSLRSH
ncbi:MAG TPA: hypothetical protein VHC48_17805, partial [Puia sp.]|nr:hypothetical protein [Puia sp.]